MKFRRHAQGFAVQPDDALRSRRQRWLTHLPDVAPPIQSFLKRSDEGNETVFGSLSSESGGAEISSQTKQPLSNICQVVAQRGVERCEITTALPSAEMFSAV